jgi:hypothetical protein
LPIQFSCIRRTLSGQPFSVAFSLPTCTWSSSSWA